MPRKTIFTKEQVLDTAMDIVRKGGARCLTTQSLSMELGCSVAPIFTHFIGMDEIRLSLERRSCELFYAYVKGSVNRGSAMNVYALRMLQFVKKEPLMYRDLVLDQLTHGSLFAELSDLYRSALPEPSDLDEERARSFVDMVLIFVVGISICISEGKQKYSRSHLVSMIDSVCSCSSKV